MYMTGLRTFFVAPCEVWLLFIFRCIISIDYTKEPDIEENLTPVEVQDEDRAEDGVSEWGGVQEGDADGRKVQHGDDLFAGPQLDVVGAPHHAGGWEPVKKIVIRKNTKGQFLSSKRSQVLLHRMGKCLR